MVSLGWHHVVRTGIFLNTSLNISEYNNLGGYKYALTDDNGDAIQFRSLGTLSSIRQYNGKTEAEIYAGNKMKFNVGAKWAHVLIKPFETKISKEVEEDKLVVFAEITADDSAIIF